MFKKVKGNITTAFFRFMDKGSIYIEAIENYLVEVGVIGYITECFVFRNVIQEIFAMVIDDSAFKSSFKATFQAVVFVRDLHKFIVGIAYTEIVMSCCRDNNF
jgi:hypothetical protein